MSFRLFLIVVFFFLSISTKSFAQLKAYEAEYNIKWHGIHIGQSKHRVDYLGEDQFVATAYSIPLYEFIPFQFYEKSELKQCGSKIKPIRHTYTYKQKGEETEGTIEFDWKNLAIERKGVSSDKIVISPTTQDKLTHVFQLQNDLNEGKTDLTYPIAKSDKLDQYSFSIMGREELKTKIGTLNTIVLTHVSSGNRKTTLWLASDLNYLTVRIIQYKNNNKIGEMNIVSFQHQ